MLPQKCNKCPENISEAGYKYVCLNARSIIKKINELSIKN